MKMKAKSGFNCLVNGLMFCRFCCFDKLMTTALRTVSLIAIYYCFSIGITFYQKWFIKKFHYPLTVVMCHMVFKLMIASLLRLIYKTITGVTRISLSWQENIRKLSATGIASALDIGFSNWSFEFITISLYTMTKSSCIVFILMFAILFDLEKKRFSLIIVVSLISSGLFMFTYHSTQFQIQGFLLVLSASLLGGLRWTLSQLVMQRKEVGLSNPLDMMYHIQPWMIIGVTPLAVMFEGIPWTQSKETLSQILSDSQLLWETISLIIIGSILAFLMEFSEFLLLTYTSSLTLSIAGIFKEVFTLYLAVRYNGDQMSPLNFFGLIVCLFGIGIHVVIKALDTTGKIVIERESKCGEVECKRLLDGIDEDVLFDLKPIAAKMS